MDGPPRQVTEAYFDSMIGMGSAEPGSGYRVPGTGGKPATGNRQPPTGTNSEAPPDVSEMADLSADLSAVALAEAEALEKAEALAEAERRTESHQSFERARAGNRIEGRRPKAEGRG